MAREARRGVSGAPPELRPPLDGHVTDAKAKEGDGEGVGLPEAEKAFGGLGASEAGRKGAEKRWAREREERERSATADVTPAQLAKIVNALRQKAENGDVAASRELREWLRQAQDQGPAQVDVLQALSPEQRAIVRDWLSQSRPQ